MDFYRDNSGLAKLIIMVEKGKLTFEGGEDIIVLFNPEKLSFTKSVSWQQERANQRDVPELQFTSASPRTLNIDLFFDTYDDHSKEINEDHKKIKKNVRSYSERLLALTMVDAKKHRPPICRLRWGTWGIFFQGVLERLTQDFILFQADATPVRTKCQCVFKEWRTNYDDLNKQSPQSSDIVKAHIVKRGDTLSSIAALEYHDPGLWRHIAEANAIDDPFCLSPGAVLVIPTLKPGQSRPRRG